MKYILMIFICIGTTSCFCTSDVKPQRFRYTGHIYSSIDSLPFRNTQFKVFDNGYRDYAHDTTHLFTTDSNGYFNIVLSFSGNVFWPSYRTGSSYTGPGVIYPIYDSTNVPLNEAVYMYNSYTLPYR